MHFRHGDGSESFGFIDLYRRGSFVLEAKKLRQTVTRGFDEDLTEQVRAVAAVLAGNALPLTEPDIAARFTGRGAWRRRLPQLLEMLAALGRARELPGGRYSAGA